MNTHSKSKQVSRRISSKWPVVPPCTGCGRRLAIGSASEGLLRPDRCGRTPRRPAPIPTWSSPAPTAGSVCRPARRSRRSIPITWRRPPFTTYIFGFRNVTGLSATPDREPEDEGAAHRAALLGRPVRPRTTQDFKVQLTNLGLQMRPDLIDAHTLHWHGFRNVIPYFDGEPTGSVAVPDRAAISPTSTGRTSRAPTCTTATSRTSSTCTWA